MYKENGRKAKRNTVQTHCFSLFFRVTSLGKEKQKKKKDSREEKNENGKEKKKDVITKDVMSVIDTETEIGTEIATGIATGIGTEIEIGDTTKAERGIEMARAIGVEIKTEIGNYIIVLLVISYFLIKYRLTFSDHISISFSDVVVTDREVEVATQSEGGNISMFNSIDCDYPSLISI